MSLWKAFQKYDTNKYTNVPAYYGQPAAGTYRAKKTTGAGKDGRRTTYSMVSYFEKNAEDPRIAEDRARQAAYQQQLQSAANAAADANRKQLLQIQSEKSAVSKMTQEYTAMLQLEADRRVKAQEESRLAMEKERVGAAAKSANLARGGQTANLQIQPSSSTPRTAGTQSFKRRPTQFNPQTYGSVATTKSGTLNI